MTADKDGVQPAASTDGKLVIVPRFPGRSFMAVLMAAAGEKTVLVRKVDLASENARAEFVAKVKEQLPAVNPAELHEQLLKLCQSRSESLAAMDKVAGQGSEEGTLPCLMVQIAKDEAELFHDKMQNGFAAIEFDDHVETWAVRSKGFRLWLRLRLRELHNCSASAETVNAALEEIESEALFDGPEAEVFVRLAERPGEVWLDLGNDKWQAIKITAAGWEVVGGKLPVRFIRPRGMLSLPVPERGGSIKDLRRFLNVQQDSDFVLLVAWLLSSLRGRGPYPVLYVNGEHGAAKSTAQKMCRSLIDPNKSLLRCEPRESRDLVITAANSWIIGFDNLSSIQPWFSDALCRLSTGGGLATRELYTNSDEVIFESQRPVMLNGITEVVNRSDLLDRTVLITLGPIEEEDRKPEKDLWAEFDEAKPGILGALLDVVAAGLAREPDVKLDKHPRMADFAVWVTACEMALGWPAGAFMAAYSDNRSSASDTAMEASFVGMAVMQFMADREFWEGTSTDLLAELDGRANDSTKRQRDWPKTPRKLSADLKRVAPNLRRAGVSVGHDRGTGKDRRRLVRLTRTDGSRTVQAEKKAEHRPPDNSLPGLALGQAPDGSDGADGSAPPLSDLDEDEHAAWEERVAIGMADGGLSQAEAEKVAWQETHARRQAGEKGVERG